LTNNRVFTIKLCRDFARNGIKSWDAVDAKALSGAFDRATSKAQFTECIRKLFGFLVKEGIVKYNYNLGHESLAGTEKYITTNYVLYKDSHARMEESVGNLFPEVNFE
jgi:hypothetical protein